MSIIKDETTCIATPGFAGFVPSLKYQFGLTYGNATRHILRTDSSLKQGVVQQEIARRKGLGREERVDGVLEVAGGQVVGDGTHDLVWKGRKKYATGDDRFSFPPVPGYTGFIPRSQEHFGRPYVETTNASLSDFQHMLASKSEPTPAVKAIKAHRKNTTISPAPGRSAVRGAGPVYGVPEPVAGYPVNVPSQSTGLVNKSYPTGKTLTQQRPPRAGGFAAGNASAASMSSLASHAAVPPTGASGQAYGYRGGVSASQPKPTYVYSAASSAIDDISPYQLPQGHADKTFISGYTGFVPRLQNHFGEPYSDTVREALDEFTAPRPPRDMVHDARGNLKNEYKSVVKTKPIPGFTGFIPGSRTVYSSTFGKTADIAYHDFNARDAKGHFDSSLDKNIDRKHLVDTLPIPGYRGHIPKYIFSAERPYGISSKECIDSFARDRVMDQFRPEAVVHIGAGITM